MRGTEFKYRNPTQVPENRFVTSELCRIWGETDPKFPTRDTSIQGREYPLKIMTMGNDLAHKNYKTYNTANDSLWIKTMEELRPMEPCWEVLMVLIVRIFNICKDIKERHSLFKK